MTQKDLEIKLVTANKSQNQRKKKDNITDDAGNSNASARRKQKISKSPANKKSSDREKAQDIDKLSSEHSSKYGEEEKLVVIKEKHNSRRSKTASVKKESSKIQKNDTEKKICSEKASKAYEKEKKHTGKGHGGKAKAVSAKKTKNDSSNYSLKKEKSRNANINDKSNVTHGKANAKHSRATQKPARKQPENERRLFVMLNIGLTIASAIFITLGIRQYGMYDNFMKMREIVDSQTFYAGTSVEGVDVSRMTLDNAMDYWQNRVEPRYAGRIVTLDDGVSVTAGELGYSSDYETILYAAWSAGRNGSLEERYRMVSARLENPVSYSITRSDFAPDILEEYVRLTAERIDRPVKDAAIDSFNTETYEFVFTEAEPGLKLDQEALRESIAEAIHQGGGAVELVVNQLAPQISTEAVASQYGLINYAITNASSSSRARLNNIKLAMSLINGKRLAPGETFSFNEVVGQRTTARGFRKAPAYSGGDVTEEVGGGICQVSTTLFNAAVKADMEILERHNHSLTVAYVDKGKDATVSWSSQDFKFKNTSEDDVYICCYLTDDKRVRFGIFGKLLPNGESITFESVVTEVIKYETVYERSPLLAHGETYVMQPGRNGYKAEAYKIRWDADGNRISKELLCKSVYKSKNEIIQYGA